MSLTWVILLFVASSVVLYFTWYKKLRDYPEDYKCEVKKEEEINETELV